MTAQRLRFVHPTVEMLAKQVEKARDRFINSGQHDHAEEWHKARGNLEEQNRLLNPMQSRGYGR